MLLVSDLYRTSRSESFAPELEITFRDGSESRTLRYRKMTWEIAGERRGLRYGENPDQGAALYRLVAGSVAIGAVETLQAGKFLASDVELLQSGKHPGKINITDVDAALTILRYFGAEPCAVIVKHNNPCGVALGATIGTAFERALLADRVAAFGGALTVNRLVDAELATAMAAHYFEVVAAPDFDSEARAILARKPNLRLMRISNIARLNEFVAAPVLEFKSLIDGGLIVQESFQPLLLTDEQLQPAMVTHRDRQVRIERAPTADERRDMRFGWLVESGVTSNSVLYVKDQVTVAIGTGEQDRVGVAQIAREKAYRNAAERISFLRHALPFSELVDEHLRAEIRREVADSCAGLHGATMVSDGFFPFCDGAEVGLREGVGAIIQPGGSMRDHEVIEVCNRHGATMVFTGQRSFRH